tara:strand:+ start:264 stop:629 length:366 start_codon:yes stop_codon:yes gene_type:complete
MNTIVRYFDRVLLLTVAAIVSLVLGWSAQAASDTPQMGLPQSGPQAAVCGKRSALLTTLGGKFAEKTVSMGLAGNGTVVEILSSEDGTWTILMTAPNGVSCLLAGGDYWQHLPKQEAKLTL